MCFMSIPLGLVKHKLKSKTHTNEVRLFIGSRTSRVFFIDIGLWIQNMHYVHIFISTLVELISFNRLSIANLRN